MEIEATMETEPTIDLPDTESTDSPDTELIDLNYLVKPPINPGLSKVDLIDNLANYLESSTKTSNSRSAQKVSLGYLSSFNESNAQITANEAKLIIENFVPSYTHLLIKQRKIKGFPKEIVKHVLEGFIGGGIGGWLCLSLIGEAVVNNILGTAYDIPGFYIGAAIGIVAPYLTVPYKKLTQGKRIENQKKALISSIHLSKDARGSETFDDYVSKFKIKKSSKSRRKTQRYKTKKRYVDINRKKK